MRTTPPSVPTYTLPLSLRTPSLAPSRVKFSCCPAVFRDAFSVDRLPLEVSVRCVLVVANDVPRPELSTVPREPRCGRMAGCQHARAFRLYNVLQYLACRPFNLSVALRAADGPAHRHFQGGSRFPALLRNSPALPPCCFPAFPRRNLPAFALMPARFPLCCATRSRRPPRRPPAGRACSPAGRGAPRLRERGLAHTVTRN